MHAKYFPELIIGFLNERGHDDVRLVAAIKKPREIGAFEAGQSLRLI